LATRYQRRFDRILLGEITILDGGLSTELERRGARMKDGVWSGHASREDWNTLVDTHRAYIDAGASIITTNTYATSRLMLAEFTSADQIADINQRSIEAALKARELSGDPDILVAGSVSHALPMSGGVEGATQQPDISEMRIRDAFDEMVEFHESGGADFLLLEMMSLPGRMLPLLQAASNSRLPVWCGFSAKRRSPEQSITAWHDETRKLDENVRASEKFGFDVLGIMHTAADLIADVVPILRQTHSGPLMAYPDSGYFVAPNWKFENILSPEAFRRYVESWIEGGVQIVGGCCGLGPEHIAAISDLRQPSRRIHPSEG
jgi:S-methylmethionine-dependent homocysteine/selenocysteine methylase